MKKIVLLILQKIAQKKQAFETMSSRKESPRAVQGGLGRRPILLILVVFMVCLLNGEKTGVLTEVMNPDQLRVSGDRCYILQGETVFIYSLKDLELIKQFGKKGEGPGEVMVVPFISNGLTVMGNKLLVDGMNKVVFFSGDGVLEKENRKKGPLSNVLPVGDGFVAARLKPGEDEKVTIVITLMDAEMKVSKELHSQLRPEQGRDIRIAPDIANVAVYKDKIFVEKSTEGFVIGVFDGKGNTLYEIREQMPLLKVTAKEREALLREYKEDRSVRFQCEQFGGWDEYKKHVNLHFPVTFSHIRDMLVREGKIYIRTYITKNGKEKYRILDLKGKALKTVFLPKPLPAPFVNRLASKVVRFFDIADDRFYYLVENEDKEEWELHMEPIR